LNSSVSIPSWPNVSGLGVLTLARFKNKITGVQGVNTDAIVESVVSKAIELRDYQTQSAYAVGMGISPGDFGWGSNSNAMNQGLVLISAYLLKKDKSFLDAAIANLDYVLGRNATGYSFLTGFGGKSAMHPHHRPSDSDGIEESVPGLLVGGPNPGQQDKSSCGNIPYPSDLPAKSYLDNVCSYASNEVAINWNAPFVYLVGAVEALKAVK
jgi:endoglucanase